MAQHDYVLANQSGANFRSDLNDALAAIVSLNAGATAPPTTYPYMFWLDTANALLKMRNAGDTAWITLPIAIGTDKKIEAEGGEFSGSVSISGSLVAPTAGMVDIVQVADSNIATSDTLAIGPFAFVPSKIVVQFTGSARHDTAGEQGALSGVCVVTITGTDTFTSNMHKSGTLDNNGAIRGYSPGSLDATKIVEIYGGNDGADWAIFSASGAWVTATKTLTLTFTSTNCQDSVNYLQLTATAYR